MIVFPRTVTYFEKIIYYIIILNKYIVFEIFHKTYSFHKMFSLNDFIIKLVPLDGGSDVYHTSSKSSSLMWCLCDTGMSFIQVRRAFFFPSDIEIPFWSEMKVP